MLSLTKGHPANKGKIIRQKGCPYWRGTTVSTLLSQKHVQWSLSLLYFITLHFKTILTYDLLILTQPQISYIADLYFKTDRLSYKNAFLSPMDDLKTQVSTLRVAVHWLSTTTFNFSVTDKWVTSLNPFWSTFIFYLVYVAVHTATVTCTHIWQSLL